MARTGRGKVPRVRQVSHNEKWLEPLAFECTLGRRFPAAEELVIDWSIEAISFGNCNCDYFCLCQFEGRPLVGFSCHVDDGARADFRADPVRACFPTAIVGARF